MAKQLKIRLKDVALDDEMVDKLPLERLACFVKYDNKQSKFLKLRGDQYTIFSDEMTLTLTDSKESNDPNLVFMVKHINTEEPYVGSVSIKRSILLEGLLNKTYTMWITLFDDPQDDEYDGQLGMDDEEKSMIQMELTIIDEKLEIESLKEKMKYSQAKIDAQTKKIKEQRKLIKEQKVQIEDLTKFLEQKQLTKNITLKEIKQQFDEIQNKIDSLIAKIQDFTLDEQQIKIKKIIKEKQNGGSQALYIHYEEKLNELTSLIKLTSEYKQDKLLLWDKDECVICSQEFNNKEDSAEEDQKYKLSCGHAQFHKECIMKWLKIKPKCPICNQDAELQEIQEEQQEIQEQEVPE